MPALKRIDQIPRYVLVVFSAICLVLGIAIVLSLTEKAFNPSLIKNLGRIVEDTQLAEAIKHTAILFLISTIFQIVLTILITIHLRSTYNWIKPLLVVPYATGVIAPAFSLYVLLSPALGPFQINILGTYLGAVVVIVLIDTWQWLGVLLLACFLILEQIPQAHFEQAQLEGIARFSRWWLIAWPELRKVIILYVAVRLIDWVRKIDVIKAIFGEGGPGHSVETVGIYIVKIYYQSGGQGYAALLSLLQIAILGFFLVLIMRSSEFRTITHGE